MTDARVVVMALAVAFGAWQPMPLPLWPLVLAAGIALAAQRQMLFVAALVLVSSAHSAQEWRHLSQPLHRTVSGGATLLADPEVSGRAYRVEVKLSGRHYELWGTGAVASQLQTLTAGQRIEVSGTVRALSGKRSPALRRKHVAGTISAATLQTTPTTAVENTLPNGLRRLLDRGSHSMSRANKALFTGLIYGDDRQQSEESVAEFRDSGLAHLTAVSGANVAFVLLLLTPVFKRFALFGRFVGAIATLMAFGELTRWEPSVLRAEAMAAIVLYASFIGRPISLLRSLAFAVTATVLIDPFLVGSIGFALSVLACVGMALLGGRMAKKLPGADAFRRTIAYSAAAQLAVAPLQLAIFGSVPLVGLATNALADPIAGLVMMWGLVAGLLAGIMGGWCATVLQFPTQLMLDWIRLVAHFGAAANRDPFLRWLVLVVPIVAIWSWSRRTVLVRSETSHSPSTLAS
jgi:competence protein ComEC